MIATVSSGHPDLSDWLLLIAFVLFVAAWIVHVAGPITVAPKLINGLSFAFAGLASLALAWLVL